MVIGGLSAASEEIVAELGFDVMSSRGLFGGGLDAAVFLA